MFEVPKIQWKGKAESREGNEMDGSSGRRMKHFGGEGFNSSVSGLSKGSCDTLMTKRPQLTASLKKL